MLSKLDPEPAASSAVTPPLPCHQLLHGPLPRSKEWEEVKNNLIPVLNRAKREPDEQPATEELDAFGLIYAPQGSFEFPAETRQPFVSHLCSHYEAFPADFQDREELLRKSLNHESWLNLSPREALYHPDQFGACKDYYRKAILLSLLEKRTRESQVRFKRLK